MSMNSFVLVSLGAAIGGSMLIAGCSGAPADSDAEASHQAVVAGQKTLVFEDGKSADCGGGEAIMGLSTNAKFFQDGEWFFTPGTGHAILCVLSYGFPFTGRVTASLNTYRDNRRAGRLGDWDKNNYKEECGLNEYVSGVSGAPMGNDVETVRCAASLATLNRSCETHPMNNWRDIGTGDWDNGYYKSECGVGKVVVGVSISPSTHHPNRILCCGE